jgi:hypothetical protein
VAKILELQKQTLVEDLVVVLDQELLLAFKLEQQETNPL